LLPISLLAAAVCAVAPAFAAAPSSAGVSRANLRSFVCQRALDPAGRAVSITAVMRPVSGTAKMALRFVLLRRSSTTAKPVAISGRALNTWITPSPPTLGQLPGDKWVLNHPVVDLAAPAQYRFKVSFRWLGKDGRALGTTTRVSRTCFEPELRPDVAVTAIGVTPLKAGQARYTAIVRNQGRSASRPFNVQLAVGSMVVGTKPVAALAPHARVQLKFRAADCTAGQVISVIADPGPPYQVDDANRANNTLQTMCPAASGSPATPSASGQAA
jgi:hypothetical protein